MNYWKEEGIDVFVFIGSSCCRGLRGIVYVMDAVVFSKGQQAPPLYRMDFHNKYVHHQWNLRSSGLVQNLVRSVFDSRHFSFSLFLIFIAILSFSTAMYGLRVLKFKNHSGKHRQGLDWLIPATLLVSAVFMSIYGFILADSLLTWFPSLGVFLALSQMVYWWRQPRFRKSWVVEHLNGMLSCGIATITAFVVFGASRMFALDEAPIWLWFTPAIVITPLIFYFSVKEQRKWQKKNMDKPKAV
ncbi:DUF2306 domain-containing protein [Salicibibacter cibi]|uniref:DUF2306 domain-containing protein n=1 Tax=Salicibibacter cibi TaxID=2743001 RepID=A0A7T7CEN3_9BACI|nr:DUF2306 domain-containing protein [Salicibibacter cibi]QQK79249.1 DUF2306 domain-containing protein [Salicibibacter cibi]